MQNRDPAAGFPCARKLSGFTVFPLTRTASKEPIMSHVLHTWLFIGANAYVEFTFVSWLDRIVYRRTLDYSAVCL